MPQVDLEEQFSLKWNDFQSNLTTGFQHLLEEEIMLDVTLSAGGQLIQAHKIILSVCSTYFKTLFQVGNMIRISRLRLRMNHNVLFL